MAGSTDNEIVGLFKKHIEPAITARLAKLEGSVKGIETTFKDVLKIAALERDVAQQAALINAFKDIEKRQMAYHAAQMQKSQAELTAMRGDTAKIQAAADKMEARLAKAEVLEARLKGMETMIQSMEQTIDMLQRRR